MFFLNIIIKKERRGVKKGGGRRSEREMKREEFKNFYKLLDLDNIKEVKPQIEKGIDDEINIVFGKEKASKIIQDNKMILKLNSFMNGEFNIPFESRKLIIPKVYFSNIFSEGCLKGLKNVSEVPFYINQPNTNTKHKIKCLMIIFSFMVTKLEEEEDDDDCNNNNNNNGGDNKKNKKWFMCDITFFCKVEDKLLGKTYYNKLQEISKDLVEFKHKQSELMKHKSGVERKKMLTENEKRRIQEYEKEIKSIEQIEIEKIDASLFHTPMIYLSHNFYLRNDISIFSQMFKILI